MFELYEFICASISRRGSEHLLSVFRNIRIIHFLFDVIYYVCITVISAIIKTISLNFFK